ncbi:trypsin Inhibitor like cysteine rich domain protein [Ancylostoma duodenale]|uniref:Trypsin Inhibitor like cysteine rich domain protein n=1 Tax=Ancylostoma duodenale TaxID=51022 RepID=A0A0C2FCG2_9BILA|nr:trypsin Inhibitor like cysteine rich domain protein [Ancylostoma duodenale]
MCVCKPGFTFNSDGTKCIPVSQCPKEDQERYISYKKSTMNSEERPEQMGVQRTMKCGKNERIERHASACYPTCADPSPSACPHILLENVCRCKPGFIRNSKGQCTKHCSSEPWADPNAVRRKCGPSTHCQPSCDMKAVDLSCKNEKCIPNACVCKPGFILNNAFFTVKRCIPVSSCPRAV